jgi:hypothetical protein
VRRIDGVIQSWWKELSYGSVSFMTLGPVTSGTDGYAKVGARCMRNTTVANAKCAMERRDGENADRRPQETDSQGQDYAW